MYITSQFIEQLRGTPLGDTGTTIYDATLLRYVYVSAYVHCIVLLSDKTAEPVPSSCTIQVVDQCTEHNMHMNQQSD